jgi:molybdenum-dependent DNA-binding transcriptional regulator ModE
MNGVELITTGYVSIKEAAKELGLSYWAMQKFVNRCRSEIKTQQLGRNILVELSSVREARKK